MVALYRLTGKNRRRYGGYIIHLGVVLMGLGIIGIEAFQTQTQATLTPGQSVELDGYTFTYDALMDFNPDQEREVTRAVIEVSENGRKITELYPRRDYYFDSQQPMTIPGLRSNFIDDLYVILVDWQPISTQQATFKIFHNPLVMWLWVGSIILMFGAFIAVWPAREKELEV